ncbi:AbrB family transcriptional regulator [Fontisubflavum oceani]|nr:AbrB family transcriptional regulator [Fontisubflavum oceani]WJY21262.1 AbrB family transcriptional regulator [Fontisubflavum oceani]
MDRGPDLCCHGHAYRYSVFRRHPKPCGRAAAASGVLTALALVTTLIAALLVNQMTALPLTDLMIAFAPGGLETMAALSIMLGADPAFTALHHVYRLLFLTFLVPAFIQMDRKET